MSKGLDRESGRQVAAPTNEQRVAPEALHRALDQWFAMAEVRPDVAYPEGWAVYQLWKELDANFDKHGRTAAIRETARALDETQSRIRRLHELLHLSVVPAALRAEYEITLKILGNRAAALRVRHERLTKGRTPSPRSGDG